MRHKLLTSLCTFAALLASGLVATVTAPPPAAAVTSLERPPKGANDWSCQPSAAHPRPVVLVHGLGANMGMNWGYLSPKLKARGYCVFALTYGLHPLVAPFGSPGGTIPIQDSARELSVFIDRVLRETGAAEVDLVGHSEGTFMPQYYLKFLGGAPKVKRYVAWTPLYDGTQLLLVPALRDAGERAGLSQPLINLVSAAVPGVEYTTVMSRYDELVIPYTSGYLEGADNFAHQYGPSVGSDGTLYYARSGDSCGLAVEFVRYPLGGAPEVVHTFPPYFDMGYYSYVDDATDGSRSIYYGTLDCRSAARRAWDSYRLFDQYAVTTVVAGTGTGSVSSNPGNIDCPGLCTQDFDRGTTVTLTAWAGAGSQISGWSAPECATATTTCRFTVNSNRTVTVTFE